MNNYRALLVDDEPLLCRHLASLLTEMWPDLEVIGSAANGEEAFNQIAERRPDVVFLDICMPKVDGITLAKKLTEIEPSPIVVFITAHNEYAVEAFEHEAIDYLLKPIQEDRLEKTLARVQHKLSMGKQQAPVNGQLIETLMQKLQQPEPSEKKLTWIKTTRQGDVYLINPRDVYYFQAEDKYTTVVTDDNEYHIRMPIKELKKQLDEDIFWQVHRSTLVNSGCIEKVSRDFSGRMFVHLKTLDKKLQVSRSFTSVFKQM
ncbi:LytTR family DNA-binding domain-containing protein [Pleionea sp. CnH1-48]|uniref:LytR/AlgR family response regulator transcription factor n=1 Tax=Pleionea sp. CnH1-48 TaxID=2954494 RepID=UPI0020983D9F|nr:LytTR family DNA-binding domain-containing protein [Pleionea sp. CnH1-48]MCO7224339.1 LytTR family DNA-binding domain-containing protein [Pleionea sp. CnH1-48]